MFKKISCIFLFVCFLVAYSSNVYAQYVDDGYSAAGIGMGGAYRGLSFDSSSIDINPAALAFLGTYHIETDYRFVRYRDAREIRVTFLDGLTSKLGTAVSWTWNWSGNLNTYTPDPWHPTGEEATPVYAYRAQNYKIALAYPISQKFALGTSLKWHRDKFAVFNDISDLSYGSNFTIDLAAQLFMPPWLSVSIVANNIIPTDKFYLPTTLSLGSAVFLGKSLTIDADLIVDFTGRKDIQEYVDNLDEKSIFNFHVGTQLIAWKSVPLRFGYNFDKQTNSQFLGAGVGLSASQFRIDYGLRYQLSGPWIEEEKTSSRLYHIVSLTALFGKSK